MIMNTIREQAFYHTLYVYARASMGMRLRLASDHRQYV